MKPIHFVLLFFAIALCVSQTNAQWVQTNGPYGGRVRGLTMAGNDLYAATDSGVYRSSNTGLNWEATGYVSTDVGYLAAVPASGGRNGFSLFVRASRKLLRSNDGGTTWVDVSNGLCLPMWDNADVRAIQPVGSKLFLATCHDACAGVYVSTDNGDSWADANSGLGRPGIWCLATIGPILFAGKMTFHVDPYSVPPTAEVSVYRSTNDGASWTKSGFGLADSLGSPFMILALVASGTTLIAATYTHGELYRSTDSGESWIQCGIPSFYTFATYGADIYATYPKSIRRSTDHGASWTEICSDFSAGCLAIAPNGTGGVNLFGGNDAGVWLSTDNGASWQPMSAGLGYLPVDALAVLPESGNGTNIFAAGGAVYRSTDSGTHWIPANLGKGGVNSLAFSPDGHGGMVLIGGTEGGIFRSTDNGISYAYISAGPSHFTIDLLTAIVTAEGGSMIFGSSEGYPGKFASLQSVVVRSTDNGESWTSTSNGLPDGHVASFSLSGQTLLAGTGNGLYATSDWGERWEFVGLRDTSIEATAVMEECIFAGSRSENCEGVFLSTDSGKTWTPVSNGLTCKGVTALLAYGDYLLAGTDSGGVFVTTDRGTNWNGTGNIFVDTEVRTLAISGVDLLVGTNRGVWRRPLSEMTSVREVATSIPTTYSLQQNYPNPFNPSTTITYELPKASIVRLSVYDMLGREVSVLLNESKDAGIHEVKFDGSNLASGVYLYRLTAGSFVETRKLVLVR